MKVSHFPNRLALYFDYFFNVFFHEGHQLWDLIMDMLSESDDTLSLQVSSGDGTICHIKDVSQDFTGPQLYVEGM